MLDFTEEIVPFKSLAGISLSDNISNYISILYENHNVETKEYNLSETIMFSYNVDNIITITTTQEGEIISIKANKGYKGSYSKFHSGITVEEIKASSQELNIINGCLVIDKNYGFAFILPSPYDEIADYPTHLPEDLILEEIFLSDFTWWYKPELTPPYAR